MTNYTTTASFWRHGLLVPEGTALTLSDAEAKYLSAVEPEKPAAVVDTPVDLPTDEVTSDETATGDETKSAKRRTPRTDGS